MQPEDIKINDWMRILVGEVPAEFFIELLVRAFFVYLILLISMRAMGKRMSSQLGRNELAALVSLAAAIGVPLMAPDRGILPAFVIAFVLIATERFIASMNCRSERFENYSQGRVSTLVSDGVVNMRELAKSRLSHERVFAQLRSNGVLQLGTVARFYMEANGSFTLVKNPEPTSGLCTLPPWDHAMRDCFTEHADRQVCVQCGIPQKTTEQTLLICPNCGSEMWVTAVKEVD